MPPPPRLLLLRSLWGVVTADGGPHTLPSAAAAVAATGAAGVECSVALATALDGGRGDFERALAAFGLLWSPVCLTSGPVWGGWDPFPPGTPRASHGDRPAAHAAALAGQLAAAASLAPSVLLREAVVLAGHDGASAGENADTIARCLDAGAAAGIGVAFETHRGRALATPWAWRAVRAALLGADADRVDAAVAAAALPLCLDAAHFVVACEVAGVGDDPAFDRALAAAAATATRLQARVASDQASQVGDPASAPAATALAETAWRAALAGAAARGQPSFIATPEFGPAPYAVAGGRSLEVLNDWAAGRVREVAAEAWGRRKRGRAET